MKIAFIGGGNMGEAMISAILGDGLAQPMEVTVSDISESRRQDLKQKYGVVAVVENWNAVAKADTVVLAVKPQNLAGVMDEISGVFQPEQVVLSIVAGVRIDTLYRGLNHRHIVRSMPNTPAQIGEGITVWTATPEVTEQQKEWACSILGATGKEIFVVDEKYLDMATAVSGSGPAYFFLFVESLIGAAVQIGLPRDTAEKLVLQTMLGSGHLIEKSEKPPAELRRMVTSPGGTTSEALQKFEQGGFRQLVLQAVVAAFNKAKELGK